jgi:hypothetical protein
MKPDFYRDKKLEEYIIISSTSTSSVSADWSSIVIVILNVSLIAAFSKKAFKYEADYVKNYFQQWKKNLPGRP